MRLINTNGVETGRLEVEEFYNERVPPYAIPSHTWGDEEVTLQNLEETHAKSKEGYRTCRECHHSDRTDAREKKGYFKIEVTCSIAKDCGLGYAWVDTCCIDKTSSAELSEAINSMYRWYEEAEVCYVYLADVSSMDELSGSRWFTRGWTLQELIAPSKVIFLDQNWKRLGTKESLQQQISNRTGIPVDILTGASDLYSVTVAQRMSWAATRLTSRLEDRAYSLLGIFGINMPLLYGEGKMSFIRLQEEIMKLYDDHSIFAWRSEYESHGGLLCTSPDGFKDAADIVLTYNPSSTTKSPWIMDNNGIHLEQPFLPIGSRGLGLLILPCKRLHKKTPFIAIYLRDVFLTLRRFERVWCENLELVDLKDFQRFQYPDRKICVQQGRLEVPRASKTYPKREHQLPKTDKNAPPELQQRKYLELIDHLPSSITKEGVSDWSPLQMDQTTKDPDTLKELLFHAANSGDIKKLKSLLHRSDIDLNGQGDDRRTMLSHAAEAGHEKVVWLLLAKSSDIKLHYSEGTTPLSYAAERGHAGVVWLLLTRGDVMVNMADYMPLAMAALKGHWPVIDILLGQGYEDDVIGRALSYTTEFGSVVAVRMLLDRSNIDVNIMDYLDGNTSLHRAMRNPDEAVAEFLISRGADIEASNSSADTPLHTAVRYGKLGIIQILLAQGANINAKNAMSTTPLHAAISYGDKRIIDILLAKGAC